MDKFNSIVSQWDAVMWTDRQYFGWWNDWNYPQLPQLSLSFMTFSTVYHKHDSWTPRFKVMSNPLSWNTSFVPNFYDSSFKATGTLPRPTNSLLNKSSVVSEWGRLHSYACPPSHTRRDEYAVPLTEVAAWLAPTFHFQEGRSNCR